MSCEQGDKWGSSKRPKLSALDMRQKSSRHFPLTLTLSLRERGLVADPEEIRGHLTNFQL